MLSTETPYANIRAVPMFENILSIYLQWLINCMSKQQDNRKSDVNSTDNKRIRMLNRDTIENSVLSDKVFWCW